MLPDPVFRSFFLNESVWYFSLSTLWYATLSIMKTLLCGKFITGFFPVHRIMLSIIISLWWESISWCDLKIINQHGARDETNFYSCVHNEHPLSLRGWSCNPGDIFIHTVFLVWELWVYVSPIARLSSRHLVIILKKATLGGVPLCLPMRISCLPRISLQSKPSVSNIFYKLHACLCN